MLNNKESKSRISKERRNRSSRRSFSKGSYGKKELRRGRIQRRSVSSLSSFFSGKKSKKKSSTLPKKRPQTREHVRSRVLSGINTANHKLSPVSKSEENLSVEKKKELMTYEEYLDFKKSLARKPKAPNPCEHVRGKVNNFNSSYIKKSRLEKKRLMELQKGRKEEEKKRKKYLTKLRKKKAEQRRRKKMELLEEEKRRKKEIEEEKKRKEEIKLMKLEEEKRRRGEEEKERLRLLEEEKKRKEEERRKKKEQEKRRKKKAEEERRRKKLVEEEKRRKEEEEERRRIIEEKIRRKEIEKRRLQEEENKRKKEEEKKRIEEEKIRIQEELEEKKKKEEEEKLRKEKQQREEIKKALEEKFENGKKKEMLENLRSSTIFVDSEINEEKIDELKRKIDALKLRKPSESLFKDFGEKDKETYSLKLYDVSHLFKKCGQLIGQLDKFNNEEYTSSISLLEGTIQGLSTENDLTDEVWLEYKKLIRQKEELSTVIEEVIGMLPSLDTICTDFKKDVEKKIEILKNTGKIELTKGLVRTVGGQLEDLSLKLDKGFHSVNSLGNFFHRDGVDEEVVSKIVEMKKGVEESKSDTMNEYERLSKTLVEEKKKIYKLLGDLEKELEEEEEGEGDLSFLEEAQSIINLVNKKLEGEFIPLVEEISKKFEDLKNEILNVKKCIRELMIDDTKKVVEGEFPEYFEMIMKTENNGNLYVPKNAGSDEIIKIFEAAALILPSVKYISFETGGEHPISIGDGGIKMISMLMSNPSNVLTDLNLNECGLNDTLLELLMKGLIANNEHIKLKILNLNKNELGSDGMVSFGEFLRINSTLESIEINWGKHEINGAGFIHIIKNILLNPRSSVESITLRRSGIYDIDKEDLSFLDDKSLTNTRMKFLRLGYSTQVGSGSGFGKIISNLFSLDILELCSSKIEDEFISGLFQGIEKLRKIRCVELEENKITSLGVKSVRECQDKSQSLFTVNYGKNDIGDEGFRYLIPGRVVDIRFQKLGLTSLSEAHIRKVVDLLPKTGDSFRANLEFNDLRNKNNDLSSLFTQKRVNCVCLDSNQNLGNIGLRKLIPILKQDHNVKCIKIRDTGFTEEIGGDFWEAMFGNGCVEEVDLGKNSWTSRGLKDFVDAVLGLETQPSTIRFGDSIFEPEMWEILFNYMKCSTCNDISLSGCKMSKETVISLFKLVDQMESLRYLRLSGNHVDVEAIKIVAKVLLGRKKRICIGASFFTDISEEDIDEELITVLASKKDFLGWFGFPYYFGKKVKMMVDERLKSTGEFFDNLTISGTTLNLSNKGIKGSIVERVVKRLLEFKEEIPKLIYLNISSNLIEDKGMEDHFSKVLKLCRDLEVLDISSCGFNDIGISCALSSLEQCKKIKNLKFSGNKIGEESMKILAKSNLIGERVMNKKKEEPDVDVELKKEADDE